VTFYTALDTITLLTRRRVIPEQKLKGALDAKFITKLEVGQGKGSGDPKCFGRFKCKETFDYFVGHVKVEKSMEFSTAARGTKNFFFYSKYSPSLPPPLSALSVTCVLQGHRLLGLLRRG